MASLLGNNDTIPLGQYLWTRIAQLGVGAVFGLPGDMNIALLDYIKDVPPLHWVGNTNELNAAYAADGYSRIKGCPGVVLTTMGAGELSAINGIAGAFSENVKIIHIVGTARVEERDGRQSIHRNLGENPDHFVYDKMSKHVRVAGCWLDDERTVVAEIDRVIRKCYLQSRPVYIYVPLDMVHRPIPASALRQPLYLSPPVDIDSFDAAVEATLAAIYASKDPVLVVDALVSRHASRAVARNLADLLQFASFSPPMGKCILNETQPYFYGCYNGKISYPGIQDTVEKYSDLVLHLGPFISDSNTGGFTRNIAEEKLILVKPNSVIVFGKEFPGIPMKTFLTDLVEGLDPERLPHPAKLLLPQPTVPNDIDSIYVTQSGMWARLGKFLRTDDIVLADTGTAQYAIPAACFPDVTYTMQGYYSSPGYSLPGTFGAAMAHREMDEKGRVVLIIGDGALQLTVQEISSMVREKLNLIIMIINNRGHTIGRASLNPKEKYHDIQFWSYNHVLQLFGVQLRPGIFTDHPAVVDTVKTKVEFDTAVGKSWFKEPVGVQILEIVMDPMDIPWEYKAAAALPPVARTPVNRSPMPSRAPSRNGSTLPY